LFYVVNGKGVIRSAGSVVRARRIAKKTIQGSEELNFALFNRYAKAKDVDNLVARFNAIDKGSELRYNAATKTWDSVDGVFTKAVQECAGANFGDWNRSIARVANVEECNYRFAAINVEWRNV
jgi:hypothetical protein